MADKEIQATGRRKTSIAVVKLVKGKGRIFVNGKKLTDYIGNRPAIEMLVYRPLVLTDNQEKYDVRVKAVGGGIVAQASAIRHGISRALLKASYRPLSGSDIYFVTTLEYSLTIPIVPSVDAPSTMIYYIQSYSCVATLSIVLRNVLSALYVIVMIDIEERNI